MWPFADKRRKATSAEVQHAALGGRNAVQILRADHFAGSGLVHHLAANHGLAMGLNWYPIVAADYVKAALARAVATKASHYVHSPQLAFVGTAKLQRADSKIKLFSLASIFARTVTQEAGVSVMVLQLSEGDDRDKGSALVWFCAVANRSVRQATDVVLPAADVKQAIEELSSASMPVKVWGEASALRELGVEVDDAIGWQQLFTEFSHSTGFHILKPAQQNPLARLKTLPKGFIWLGAAAMVLLLWKSAIGPLANKVYARLTSVPQVIEQPAQLWADALQLALSQTQLTAPGALSRLVDSIGIIPSRVGEQGARWQLKGVQCDADIAQKRWLCKAAYEAMDKAATNAEFQAAAKTGWGVEFHPLKKASYTFQFALAVRPLVLKEHRSRTEHLLSTASSLQRLQPVLKDSPRAMSEFSPIKLQNPSFANGQPVPPVVDVKLPLTAQIQVTGPLRTAVIMDDLDPHVSWRSLRISFDPSTKPDSTSSALNMEVMGEIYANS